MSDIDKLSSAFPESVFSAGSEEYKAAAGSYYSAFENEVKPLCFLQPKTAEELGGMLVKLTATNATTAVAVKGGGHMAWAGAANAEQGITIDLKNFKGIDLDLANGVVTLGVLENWASVYAKLAEHGLAICGGRVDKVAISGLTMGGGQSYHSRAMGFVCDNVTNYEVVLASGEVVQANKTTNPDLFVALKGGSNNFGIATKFTYPTFKQGPMWGGGTVVGGEAWPTIVDKVYAFVTSTDPADKHGAFIAACAYFPQAGLDGCVVSLTSTDPTNVSKNLRAMANIQPQYMNMIRETTTLSQLVEDEGKFNEDNKRGWWMTMTIKLSKEFLVKAQRLYQDMCQETAKRVAGFGLAMTLQPHTVDQLQASKDQGPNALGLSPEDGPLMNLLLCSLHEKVEEDEKSREAANKLLDDLTAVAKGLDVYHRYKFMNYATKGQEVIESYGPENVKMLWAVSQKYDPEGFFQKRVTGGHKLPCLNATIPAT
ncbi:FAD-binding domain-containing protein [Amniculicola lignicola CBS 123094]|uniref:FAD-binding domain-containing protein n=1 Tax=Amniculicola lignicola CBS 123094 TaxID=1392246 RepID=A0A6A5WTL2_9PLEO|nr:FAD-binding domain-containing protein [Amniculicola lignicola CBS 123094]